ncbi:type II toxin-antitoxin system RelE/ParE family toxin [Serratia plymuthica]|nr:type II toxin-antitoxin system RelE/ParE family toxin [Serratia plymuthica]UTN96422.1 type II toxin-antitoxin system RelE/ParE family toxin [Serratia plymuthica]
MTLKWTEPAIADRMAIYDYLETKNPAAAIEIDSLISAAATRLSQNPSVENQAECPVHVKWLFIIPTF